MSRKLAWRLFIGAGLTLYLVPFHFMTKYPMSIIPPAIQTVGLGMVLLRLLWVFVMWRAERRARKRKASVDE